MQRQKVLPCLFPWKRTTHRRFSISNITPFSNKSSLSPIRYISLYAQIIVRFFLPLLVLVFIVYACFLPAYSCICLVFNRSDFAFSRKLKLSRQRDTVYTRSTNGFSLRKSRVLSIGGSSLKWSKSIERRSKKASEVRWTKIDTFFT